MKWFGMGLLVLSCLSCLMVRKYESIPIQALNEKLEEAGVNPSKTPETGPQRWSHQQVLKLLGPPTHYLQTREGLWFVYLYKGRHLNEFFLGAPRNIASGRFTFFDIYFDTYKQDKLMIFFDRNGFLADYAYHEGTDELSTFF